MNIACYAPLKPLDHPDPSGDRTIGRELVAALTEQGLHVVTPSRFRSRWFSCRPRLWLASLGERRRALEEASRARVSLWLTYHPYYKAPDVIGPYVARELHIPYVIFQGIYSTKPKRALRTRLGYELNRKALIQARQVYSNRRLDLEGLRRIVPEERLLYVVPGIDPNLFAFDGQARRELRRAWGVTDEPVIVTAAMFRDDVKTRSLVFLLERLGELARAGERFYLVLVGDGETRDRISALAATELLGRHRFLGLVPREELGAVFGAGDVFAFPGFRESLGMVYLEAQAAGLPVVAFADGGVPEVVRHRQTGILTPPGDAQAYRKAITWMLEDKDRRRRMGEAAERYVRQCHDRTQTYHEMVASLKELSGKKDNISWR